MMCPQGAIAGPNEKTGSNDGTPNTLLYYACKRFLDIVTASVLLILLTPVFLIIALLIKLDSPGPAFFIQERMGSRLRVKGGQIIWEQQTFQMYKFRSMLHNADESLHRHFIKSFINGTIETTTCLFKLTNDPRLTQVGKWLRKTSVDELPQLINVLKGEMSLIGPRPVPTYEVAEYQPWHYERLNALPGIAGLWQVTARSSVEFDQMVTLDIEYVRNQSLIMDMKILILLIPALLSCRGAA